MLTVSLLPVSLLSSSDEVYEGHQEGVEMVHTNVIHTRSITSVCDSMAKRLIRLVLGWLENVRLRIFERVLWGWAVETLLLRWSLYLIRFRWTCLFLILEAKLQRWDQNSRFISLSNTSCRSWNISPRLRSRYILSICWGLQVVESIWVMGTYLFRNLLDFSLQYVPRREVTGW